VISSDRAHERAYRWLLHLYPAEFRARFEDDLVQLFGDRLRDARSSGASGGVVVTWLRTLADLVMTAASEHARRDRTVAQSLPATSPSTASRALGLAGILGGAVLLAAFLFEISPELNAVRIYLFLIGAIAIVIGVHRRQASVVPTLALLGAVPALLANAWYLAMMVLATGRPQPFAGDFGLVFIAAAVAMHLTDAAFGLVTLRLGLVSRWGAVTLAVGSALAVTGIDRLGLAPAIFGPVSQVGIMLAGIGWILLGLDLATRRRPSEAHIGWS
jgi:hypothetical protein